MVVTEVREEGEVSTPKENWRFGCEIVSHGVLSGWSGDGLPRIERLKQPCDSYIKELSSNLTCLQV